MARSEITGKKNATANGAKKKKTRKRKPPKADPTALAFTIKTFCAVHNISESKFFALKRQGHGPREMAVGDRGVRISAEAAADWRKQRETANEAANAAEA